MEISITLRNVAVFQISNTVSNLLVWLWILWHLYPIWISLWRDVLYLYNRKYLVTFSTTFLRFSVTDYCGWFWMGSHCKNALLMLWFLKVSPSLVPLFSWCILKTFLTVLSVILLSLLLIITSWHLLTQRQQ